MMSDESVGIGRIVGHGPLLVRRRVGFTFAIIVTQIVRFQRLAKGQFLRMPNSQFLAERNDSVECLDAEIHPAIQVAQIGQLDAQSLVHRREMEQSIRLNSVLIQRRTSPREPAVAGGPPKCVIRPIGRNVCNNRKCVKIHPSRVSRDIGVKIRWGGNEKKGVGSQK